MLASQMFTQDWSQNSYLFEGIQLLFSFYLSAYIHHSKKKFLCKIHYLQWNVIHYIAELLWFLILYIFVDDWTDVSLIVICNFFDNIVLPIHKQSNFKELSLISLMKLALAVNFLYEIISLLDYSSLLVEVAYYL